MHRNLKFLHMTNFFSTQKRVNRNKTDLATKQRESLKNKNCAKKQHKMWQNSINAPQKHHTNLSCGEISDFSTSAMWRNLKLLHMWRNFRFLHICHAYKFEISPHDKFFSTDISVGSVTNIRYGTEQISEIPILLTT